MGGLTMFTSVTLDGVMQAPGSAAASSSGS